MNYTEAEAVVREALGELLASFPYRHETPATFAPVAALDEMRREFHQRTEMLLNVEVERDAAERRLAEAETALNGMVDLFGRQHAEASEVYAVKQAVAYLASRDQEDQV
jgi:hypothetical protein